MTATITYHHGPVLRGDRVEVVAWGTMAPALRPLVDLFARIDAPSSWSQTLRAYAPIAPRALLGAWWDRSPAPDDPSAQQVEAVVRRAVMRLSWRWRLRTIIAVTEPYPYRGSVPGICGDHSWIPWAVWRSHVVVRRHHRARIRFAQHVRIPYMWLADFVGWPPISGTFPPVWQCPPIRVVAEHEYAETVTDPVPPTGWTTGPPYYEEIADVCQFAPDSLAVAAIWNVAEGACVR